MKPPHGGKLVYRVDEKKDVDGISVIEINEDVAKDIENIAYGIFSPLEGFMCKSDFENVLEHMRLENDVAWTIPIVFDIENKIREGEEVLLKAKSGTTAIFEVEEVYKYDKKEYAEKVFKTTDIAHPGVKRVMEMKDKLAGGKITLVKEGKEKFEKYYLKPYETRILFKEKGWKDIVAFQTRNKCTPYWT